MNPLLFPSSSFLHDHNFKPKPNIFVCRKRAIHKLQ
ncbi:hypothetical protein CsSME_00005390 [Camellia sinensis var. sinensis]